MRILCVVQRYGPSIMGGAELHCRLVAEHLAQNHAVEVATTCAADYLTWKNVFAPGTEIINGIPVHRFPVVCERPADFDILAHQVLHGYPDAHRQREYLEALGPVCPSLIDYITACSQMDRCILFSYRYWTTWQALHAAGKKTVLVPTAEHDRTLYLDIYRESFHRPLSIAYNSVEERDIINRVSGNRHVPGITVGVGLAETEEDIVPAGAVCDMPERFFLYVGRIEEAKGCCRLIADYMTFFNGTENPPALVLIGNPRIPIPDHPGIFHMGVQPDPVKMHVLSQSIALIMPSRYESLSMVVLEAWKSGRPVVCNAHCEVLKGQCLRSKGGLYYRNTDEFIEILDLMQRRADVADTLGQSGRSYYRQHYLWPVILHKYQSLLEGTGDCP